MKIIIFEYTLFSSRTYLHNLCNITLELLKIWLTEKDKQGHVTKWAKLITSLEQAQWSQPTKSEASFPFNFEYTSLQYWCQIYTSLLHSKHNGTSLMHSGKLSGLIMISTEDLQCTQPQGLLQLSWLMYLMAPLMNNQIICSTCRYKKIDRSIEPPYRCQVGFMFWWTALMVAQGLFRRPLTEEPLLALHKCVKTSVELYKKHVSSFTLSVSHWVKWIKLTMLTKILCNSSVW